MWLITLMHFLSSSEYKSLKKKKLSVKCNGFNIVSSGIPQPFILDNDGEEESGETNIVEKAAFQISQFQVCFTNVLKKWALLLWWGNPCLITLNFMILYFILSSLGQAALPFCSLNVLCGNLLSVTVTPKIWPKLYFNHFSPSCKNKKKIARKLLNVFLAEILY